MGVKVRKRETYISSSNGRDRLHVVVWEPAGEKKAVLQISHGMVEYIERYDDFARYMASHGIVVAGNDHLGHGKTARNSDELGYMAAYDASRTMVSDLHRVTVCLKRAYEGLPFFLLGHSMGSFLARRYMTEYGYDSRYPSENIRKSSIDGFICLGTGSQPGAALKTANLVYRLERAIRGEKYRSKLMMLLAFGTYQIGIPAVTRVDGKLRRKSTKDWLSRDTKKVDTYMANPFCSFSFTLKGYKTLFDTIDFIQKENNIARIPKKLPVLFVSGNRDPVGHHGKDVRKLYRKYLSDVSNDVTCILYRGARHEVLHEIEYQKAYDDILKWIKYRL
jgi:alpha-beta hydrolase superfamily lysophospholipase